MKIGDAVGGVVVRSGSWGVYFRTPGGVVGFVDALELSWSHSVSGTLIPDVGSGIAAVVTRVFAVPQAQGHSFVASVRRLVPAEDPWIEENRPMRGQSLPGTVFLVGEGFAVVELASGAAATIHPSPCGLEVGQAVEVTVTDVDPDRRIIRATM